MKAKSEVILLDGGMGQEIVNRGGRVAYGEWAVAALYENPAMVQAIHRDYIQAGADIITTNTYSATRTRLRHVEMEDRFEQLVQLAGRLAVQAREASAAGHVKIAACLPPLEASYVSQFALSFDEMTAQYRELMDLLDPYVDSYLGETLSTSQEARAVLKAAQGRDKPIWIAWTLQDHGSSVLRGGETLQDALASLDPLPDAILINCCTPNSIDSALPDLRSSGLPFGGYANGFVEIPDEWDDRGGVAQLQTRTDLSPPAYADRVQRWIAAGAVIVGGCCEVGPAHIARLRQLIDQESDE